MKTGLCAFLFLVACSSTNHTAPVCGDGLLDSGEQCDDGNTVDGDGCSATCTIETANVCGDGTTGGNEECDDGNTTGGDGCSATCHNEFRTTATWTFKTTTSMTPLACPNGFDTAAVYSQQIDASGNPVGQPVIDLFTCSDGTGVTSYLDEGVYDTWISITDHAGTTTYASTVDALVDHTTADATYSADIVEDGGYFAWKWALQGKTSNTALTCADVTGITGVELVTVVSGTAQMYTDQFTCDDGRGVTAVIPQGLYTVSADAINGNNDPLGRTTLQNNEQITGPNKISDLGTITIPIDGM